MVDSEAGLVLRTLNQLRSFLLWVSTRGRDAVDGSRAGPGPLDFKRGVVRASLRDFRRRPLISASEYFVALPPTLHIVQCQLASSADTHGGGSSPQWGHWTGQWVANRPLSTELLRHVVGGHEASPFNQHQ